MATQSQLNIRNGLIVLLAAGLVAVGLGFNPLAATDTGPKDNGDGQLPNGVRKGTASTMKAATFDQTADSQTQVGTSVYAWKTDSDGTLYLGSTSSGASSRATFNDYVVGDSYKAIAFGSTYDYGAAASGSVNAETKLVNLDVFKGVSSANVETTMYDKNGDSTTSVALGADEQYAFSGFEVRVANSNVAYNPKLIAFNLPSNTNISNIEMPNAQKVSDVPKTLDNYEYVFKAYSANQGKPSMMEWETQKTGSIVVTADSDGTSGESVTVAVKDSAPFIGSSDSVKWGVEDDSNNPSDVGVSDVTQTVTFN